MIFANPSDHTVASAMVGIAILLDVFHGSPIHLRREVDFNIFHSNFVYYPSLMLMLVYQIMVPYSAFFYGFHDMSQIVYGITIGIWLGLFAHFFVRDNLIRWAVRVRIEKEIGLILDNGLNVNDEEKFFHRSLNQLCSD